MKAVQRLGIGLIGIGVGFVLISHLIETYTVASRNFFVGEVLDASSTGIAYTVFGLVSVGWSRVSRARRPPLRIALFTAGLAIATVIGTELAVGSVGAVDRPWDPLRYLVPAHFVSFCVAWLLSIVVADPDGYSHRRTGLLVGLGPALILLLPLAVAVSGGYALRIVLPAWAYAAVVVVVLAGLYTIPAYLYARIARGREK